MRKFGQLRILTAGLAAAFSLSVAIVDSARAQMKVEPPLVFGYFQNTLAYVNGKDSEPDYTSFSVQQLNLMMQKELTPSWTAFVNLEFLNSFSTGKMFGELNLEEAWVRYRINQRMSLKLGLHTPEFNRLNSIKTKMPLLPYIIRPLVYETSVSESIPIHEYVPDDAYISLYGALPIGSAKLDHSVYVGNSPNLSTTLGHGQSAVDTSKTFLTGFRVGIRTMAVQAGVSGTLDFVDYEAELRDYVDRDADVTDVPRYRFGSDLRVSAGPVTFEGEMIKVWYDDDIAVTLIDKSFYYGTVLVSASERLTLFAGYWYTEQDVTGPLQQGIGFELINFAAQQRIPNVGASYTISDQITAKGQFGKVDEDVNHPDVKSDDQFDFMYYGLAVSVMF